jgi:hypothetical protein
MHKLFYRDPEPMEVSRDIAITHQKKKKSPALLYWVIAMLLAIVGIWVFHQ